MNCWLKNQTTEDQRLLTHRPSSKGQSKTPGEPLVAGPGRGNGPRPQDHSDPQGPEGIRGQGRSQWGWHPLGTWLGSQDTSRTTAWTWLGF